MVALAHQAALAVEDTRYYSALVQAERLAARQTVATISHHIKNILQGIRGGSYLIELGLAEHNEELIQKGWKIVEKNQQRISSLVMDMLTFSKEREPELVPADLNRVVEEVIELMQSRAAELGVTLHWEPQPDIPSSCSIRKGYIGRY
jgi:two-component system NtrC family sensor kinase